MRYSCKNKSNSDHTSLMNNFNSFTPQKQIKHFVSNFDFLNNSKKNQKISKSKVIKNLILSKNTSTLTKITFCFYREYIYSNESYIKFNPLDNISDEILLKNNFIKCMMNLNTTFGTLRIIPENGIKPIIYSIDEIERTVVNSMIKMIVEIHQKYQNYNFENKNNSTSRKTESFIDTKIKEYPQLKRRDIKNCLMNKRFNFFVIFKNGKKIEFILFSYEDFKTWINGLSSIINKRIKNINGKTK